MCAYTRTMHRKFLLASALSLVATTSLSAHDDLGVGYHWSILTEFVYMRRTELHSRTLVDRYDPGKGCPCDERRVLTSKNLLHDFSFEPGYRVGLAYQPNSRWSLEGSFLYLNEWQGHDKKHGNASLSFPFYNYTSTVDYRNADEADAIYKSHFYSAEVNFWRDVTPRKVQTFSLIRGFSVCATSISMKSSNSPLKQGWMKVTTASAHATSWAVRRSAAV